MEYLLGESMRLSLNLLVIMSGLLNSMVVSWKHIYTFKANFSRHLKTTKALQCIITY